METYPVPIGEVTFSISDPSGRTPDPASKQAADLSHHLALTFNSLLMEAVAQGRMPACAVRAEIARIEAGSLLTTFLLYVDVADVVGTAVIGAGLYKLLKDYSALKKSVLEIAGDIDSIARWSFLVLRKTYRVAVVRESISSETQLQRDVEVALAQVRAEVETREQESSARARQVGRRSQSEPGVPS